MKNYRIKKLIIVIVMVILLNFSIPSISMAANLSESIADFLLILPDGFMWILQHNFLAEGDVNIKVHSNSKEQGYMSAMISGGGKGVDFGGKAGSIIPIPIVGSLAGGIVGGIVGGVVGLFMRDDGNYNLPNIKFTPYAIFTNKIPILNADFFEEVNDIMAYVYPGRYDPINGIEIPSIEMKMEKGQTDEEVKNKIRKYLENFLKTQNTQNNNMQVAKYISELIMKYAHDRTELNKKNMDDNIKKFIQCGTMEMRDFYEFEGENISVLIDEMIEEAGGDLSTVESAFSFESASKSENDIVLFDAFDIDLSNGIPDGIDLDIEVSDDWIETEMYRVEKREVIGSVSVLKPIVSKWYNILRTIAIVGLLSVLVYIGIRILIYSTSAQDKAKYKNMLKDWLIGLCLLFVLHFIMSFTMAITRHINHIFEDSEIENQLLIVQNDLVCIEGENDAKSKMAFYEHYSNDSENATWKLNIVERFRQCITISEARIETKVAYIIIYIIIVIEVAIFTYQYLKRVITMAMLTLIAPLVALTYPIDKINDGKAQGFNMWLKEYIFNALLQPMHLILYTIIISSVSALVESNPLYAIVALGCMTPMEKLLRKIFGFSKAESVGAFGGAAGAAVLMSTIGSLSKIGKRPRMGKGREEDNKIKLWENKRSLDAEDILMGTQDVVDNKYKVKGSLDDLSKSSKKLPASQINKIHNKKASNKQANNKETVGKQAGSKKSTNIPIQKMATNNQIKNRSKSSGKKPTIKNPRLHALGQVGNSYRRRLTRDLTPGKVLRSGAKLTGKVLGGVGLGTVGLAAGIASGDLGKAVQYSTTAGVAGATLTSSIVGNGIDHVKNMKDTYQEAYASADEEYATNKRIKEFNKNEENMKYIESRYINKEEQQEVLETMENVAEYGITDVQDISAIYEMMKQENLSLEQSVAVSKMSKNMGDIRSPKVQKEWKEHFESQGYSNDQITKLFKKVKKYQKERD